MASTTVDDTTGTAGPADDTPSSQGDTPPSTGSPGGSDTTGPVKDTRYDDAADEVAESMSAAAAEEFTTAIGAMRGDIVAGDKYVVLEGRRGGRVRFTRIPGETLAHPHVEATGLHRIDEVVRHYGMVAVRGPDGSGRAAALLSVFAGGSPAVTVLRLHPHTDLRTLAPEHIHDAQAVILEDLTKEHLDQLDEGHEIDRLRHELKSRWLGFTVAADVGLPEALTPMVVDIGEPPLATEVFQRHFQAAQPSGARRTALLDAAGVQDRVDVALRPPVRLGRAAGLAAFLAAYQGPVEELAGWLDAWLTRGADAERQRWFQALPGLRAHSTALALAVFHGLTRETVMAQAERLIEQAALPSVNENRHEPVNVFTSGVPLAALRATASREKVSYAEGDVTSAVLRFTDPDYQPWVLQHAWDESDAARPAIVAWLRELGDDPDPSIRFRAASATAVLAERAFRTINNQLIAEWAAGPDNRARYCAALALSDPTDRDLAATVTRMLDGWINGRNPDRQATAALHLGITAEPTTAADRIGRLGRLADLVDRDDTTVTIAVATSLADMLGRHRGAMGSLVVHETTLWMHRPTWLGRKFAAHLAFLRMTALVGDPTVARREDPNRSTPSLLIGARGEEFARLVSTAWQAGLTGRFHRNLSWSLKRWAEHVEKRPEFEQVFVWMLREAATDARTETIVRRTAGSWQPDTAPRTAAAVLRSLRGAGHG